MNKFHIFVSAAMAVVLLTLPISSLAGHLTIAPEKAVTVKSDSQKPVSSFAVQFDISGVGKGQNIDFAVLKLVFNADTALGEGVGIRVYAAGESWEQSLLARSTPVDVVDTLMTISHSGTGEESQAEFDVSDIVRAWYLGQVSNDGFVFSVCENQDRKFELANKAGEWGVALEVFFTKAE